MVSAGSILVMIFENLMEFDFGQPFWSTIFGGFCLASGLVAPGDKAVGKHASKATSSRGAELVEWGRQGTLAFMLRKSFA